eukprot:2658985-Rhodomonas_salina.2
MMMMACIVKSGLGLSKARHLEVGADRLGMLRGQAPDSEAQARLPLSRVPVLNHSRSIRDPVG